MLDSKLADIIKPLSEVSEKFDNLIESVWTVEWVLDLEDVLATTTPWWGALEVQLKKAEVDGRM